MLKINFPFFRQSTRSLVTQTSKQRVSVSPRFQVGSNNPSLNTHVMCCRFFTDADKATDYSIEARVRRIFPGIENTDEGFRNHIASSIYTIEQQMEMDCLNDEMTLKTYLPDKLFDQSTNDVLEIGCHIGVLVPALFKAGLLTESSSYIGIEINKRDPSTDDYLPECFREYLTGHSQVEFKYQTDVLSLDSDHKKFGGKDLVIIRHQPISWNMLRDQNDESAAILTKAIHLLKENGILYITSYNQKEHQFLMDYVHSNLPELEIVSSEKNHALRPEFNAEHMAGDFRRPSDYKLNGYVAVLINRQ